jgi:hypothetical protein
MALLVEGSPWWCDAAAEVAFAANRIGRAGDVAEVAGRLASLAGAEERPSDALAIALLRVTAIVLYGRRDELADLLLPRVHAWAEAGGARTVSLRARLHVVRAYLGLRHGDAGTGLTELTAARDLYLQIGHRRQVVNQQSAMGHALSMFGRFGEAASLLSATADLAASLGLRHEVATARYLAVRPLVRSERTADAIEAATDAVAMFEQLSDPYFVVWARAYLAEGHLAAGALELAERETELAIAAEANPIALPFLRALRARIRLGEGRPAEAVAELERLGPEVDPAHVFESGELEVRLVHAEALLAAGEREAATAAVATGRARLDEVAARIADPGLRESFLTRVPEHVRLAALHAELCR